MLYVKHSLETERHGGAGGGVFHLAEAGADRGAGAFVFLLYRRRCLRFCSRRVYIVGLYVQELRNLPAEVMSPAMAAFTKWLSYLFAEL